MAKTLANARSLARDDKGRFVKGHVSSNTGKTHFKKGFSPWNKGTKGLIEPWNKGKKTGNFGNGFKKGHITWNKGARMKSISGSNHYLWKGTTPLNKWIRNSAKYSTWRKTIFERDNYTCQVCDKRGGRLVVDHYPLTLAQLIDKNDIKTIDAALGCNELWDIDRNRVLCEECHFKTDNFGKRSSPVYKFLIN